MTALYRAYDADDSLLYVGISIRWPDRLKTHSMAAPWFVRAVRVSIEHFKDRDGALAAERLAINSERPIFNVQHNKPKVVEPESDNCIIGNMTFFLATFENGGCSLDDFPDWFVVAHYILAYPKRLARFTEMWIDGDIPDGNMSASEIIAEMNEVDTKAPTLKSLGSYQNWKAKGFPGFERPKKPMPDIPYSCGDEGTF